jgi:hypothetical protein
MSRHGATTCPMQMLMCPNATSFHFQIKESFAQTHDIYGLVRPIRSGEQTSRRGLLCVRSLDRQRLCSKLARVKHSLHHICLTQTMRDEEGGSKHAQPFASFCIRF